MDYFFRLEGATVSIYKSGKVLLQGNDLTSLPELFGQDAGNLKRSTSSARQDLTMIGTDEVGNGSYFGGLTVVASFVTPDQHDWLKKLGGGFKKPGWSKNSAIGSSLRKHPAPSTLYCLQKKYNEGGHYFRLQCGFGQSGPQPGYLSSIK